MYYFKEFCCGELSETIETETFDEMFEKIENRDFIFTSFEVIKGEDITQQVDDLIDDYQRKKMLKGE